MINCKDLNREELKKYSEKGYVLFEVTKSIETSIISKDNVLCKNDDLIYKSFDLVISLANIDTESITIEIFNKDTYTIETIPDKLSSHTLYLTEDNGNLYKLFIRYKKRY